MTPFDHEPTLTWAWSLLSPPGERRRPAADHIAADGHLWIALSQAYDELGFGPASGGDEVSHQLMLARIIEPASKPGSLRALAEAGVAAPSCRTLRRPLPVFAQTPGTSSSPRRALLRPHARWASPRDCSCRVAALRTVHHRFG